MSYVPIRLPDDAQYRPDLRIMSFLPRSPTARGGGGTRRRRVVTKCVRATRVSPDSKGGRSKITFFQSPPTGAPVWLTVRRASQMSGIMASESHADIQNRSSDAMR